MLPQRSKYGLPISMSKRTLTKNKLSPFLLFLTISPNLTLLLYEVIILRIYCNLSSFYNYLSSYKILVLDYNYCKKISNLC